MKKITKKLQNSDLKIKISEIDIETFKVQDMKIDPYWNDLYNPKKLKIS